jgi:predicted MFS family arabinose efflux permease
MSSSETTRLLRRPGYARYFTVVAAARASGSMFNVSGVLLVLERTGSLTLAGLVVAAATLPGALTGPFLGAWLDIAHSRRRLLVIDRAVTFVSLGALLALAGHSPGWVLVAVGVAYGATSPLSSGAFSSVLPEVAGAELLNVANTFEATSINIAFIVGPALAGLVAALAGAPAAIETQMAVGVVLALAIATDATFELRPEHEADISKELRRTVSEGLGAMWRIAPLRWNVITSMVYVAAWGTLNVGFPAFAEAVHAGAHSSGYMWAAISFGSMASAFALRTPALRLAPWLLISVSFLAMAASVALWPLAHGLAAALALVMLTGALEGPSLVALLSVRQRLAPTHLRGQIFSTTTSLNLAAAAVGAAVAGPFHAAAGTTATLLAFGALMAAAALIALGTRAREDRRADGAPELVEAP